MPWTCPCPAAFACAATATCAPSRKAARRKRRRSEVARRWASGGPALPRGPPPPPLGPSRAAQVRWNMHNKCYFAALKTCVNIHPTQFSSLVHTHSHTRAYLGCKAQWLLGLILVLVCALMVWSAWLLGRWRWAVLAHTLGISAFSPKCHSLSSPVHTLSFSLNCTNYKTPLF